MLHRRSPDPLSVAADRCEACGVRSADTEFVGGPLDGRVLPILLSPVNSVPKVYRVPVPAYGPPDDQVPATTLVYRRAKEYDPKGRWRWRYEYDAGNPGIGDSTDSSAEAVGPDGPDGV